MFVAPPVAAQDVIISTRLPSGQELARQQQKAPPKRGLRTSKE